MNPYGPLAPEAHAKRLQATKNEFKQHTAYQNTHKTHNNYKNVYQWIQIHVKYDTQPLSGEAAVPLPTPDRPFHVIGAQSDGD